MARQAILTEAFSVSERAPNLLVIEDAQDQAILVGVAARNTVPGLEVHIAGDGRQGIEYLSGVEPLRDPPAHPTPDLVILDLIMPDVDGFGVLEWIGETFGTPPFPVVVLTGSPNPEHERRARDLGATAIHQKPSQLDALGAAVRSIVTRWISPSDLIAAHIRSAG